MSPEAELMAMISSDVPTAARIGRPRTSTSAGTITKPPPTPKKPVMNPVARPLKPSFIPPAPIRDRRELTRYRKTLVQGRTQEVNRLHTLLAGANRKLGAVAADILGKSGRAMRDALLGGEQEPAVLAALARGRMRAKLPLLRRALEGRLRPVHLTVLAAILGHIDGLDEMVARLHDAIAAALAPFAEAVELLRTIPGISAVAAAAIVAEIGVDMGRFPSHKHRASWAGVCPGNKQRGGKRLSGKTTTGSAWLRAVLTAAAWANARRTTGYLGAPFRRLARRRGRLKALVAVAHRLIVIIYHVLRDRRPYTDLGADYFATLEAERVERHHVRRRNALGYSVTLTPLPPTEPVPACGLGTGIFEGIPPGLSTLYARDVVSRRGVWIPGAGLLPDTTDRCARYRSNRLSRLRSRPHDPTLNGSLGLCQGVLSSIIVGDGRWGER